MSKSLDPKPGEKDPLDGIIVFASSPRNSLQNGRQSEDPITLLWPPPSNGSIPSPTSTAVDECPSLVSSDEETECVRNNDELVKKWMTLAKNKNRLEQELQKIVVQGVGLYLLGVSLCAPPVWINAQVAAGVFDREEKECLYSLHELSDKLLLLAEVMEEIFRRNQRIFSTHHQKTLKAVLDMIDDIEKNGPCAEVIEVQRALQIAMDCSFFNEEWQELRKVVKVQTYINRHANGDSQPVLFLLLFFYKLVHYHVSYFGTHQGTRAGKILRDILYSSPYSHRIAKDEGNRYFRNKEYDEAIKMYSASMIKDYGNSILYGNRAQCYLFKSEYRKAYCDSRRAIFLNPKWFKGYYRAAEACLHMNRLDEAWQQNKNAQHAYNQSDEKLQMDILKQRQKIIAALRARGGSAVDMEDYALIEKRVEADVRKLSAKKEKITDLLPGGHSHKPPAQDNVNNNSKDKLKTRMESESSRGSHPPGPEELTSFEKFVSCLREAVEAYNVQNPVRAAAKYESALDLYGKSTLVKSLVSDYDLTVLRFSFGITAVSQDGLKTMIREGHRTLQALYKEQSHTTFPLVIYGLGIALVALYRFAEARKVVDIPITNAMKKGWREVCWPGSKQTIEESKLGVFLREMMRLKELCRFPPPPDAICFEHVDHSESRHIYKDSPLFEVQGLVKLTCYEKCVLHFHYATCWKEYRGRFSVDKISDKDMVDKPCPTPDCGSFISCILIQKPDKRPLALKSEQHPVRPRGNHKVGRMTLSNPDKIARRAERKELKRQKRAEARQLASRQTRLPHSSPEQKDDDLHSGSVHRKMPQAESGTSLLHSDPVHWKISQQAESETAGAMPPANAMVILQKEEQTDDIKYNPFHNKARTNKKKKEKVNRKQVNMVVTFTDDAERDRVGEQDAVDEDQEADLHWTKPPRMGGVVALPPPLPVGDPFAVPPHLRGKVVAAPFSEIVANQPSRNPLQSQKEEQIRQTVIEFLVDFLRESGPQHLEEPTMHQTLECFPEESNRIIEQYGGIGPFLAKHADFFVVDKYVGVREDYEKVQSMADSFYDPPPNSVWASPNPYDYDRSFVRSSYALVETSDDIGEVNSQTFSDHTGNRDQVSTASSVNPLKSRVETEMTLPRCEFGLNPTAPEFQPGQRLNQERLGVNGFDTEDDADWNVAPSDRASTMHQYSDRLDMQDSFTSGIDDIDDDETLQEWIDEGNMDPPTSGSYADLEDLGAGQQATGQDGMSRRSSRSDLSQTSDLSTGAVFRAASSSSSASSHKAASTRDVGSPFSMRDTSSPALLQHAAHAGDLSHKTGSLVNSWAAVSSTSPITVNQRNSELGFVSNMAASAQSTAAYSSSAECDSLWPRDTNTNSSSVPGAPKPLKPLTPVWGAGSHTGGMSVSMGSSRAPDEGASTPMGSASVGNSALSHSVSSTLVKSTVSSSVLHSSSSTLALTEGLSSSSLFPSSFSLTWGTPCVPASDHAWATNSFPSAIRPDEDVVNCIPPFPTSSLTHHASSSAALPQLASSPVLPFLPSSTDLPPPIPLPPEPPSFSHCRWSDSESSNWFAAPLGPKVNSATQASVEVCSVEVNTEMSERDIQSLLMQQHKFNEAYQQLHHFQVMNERSQQEMKKKEEEKQVAQREAEELRRDLKKTVQQMDNLDTELERIKEWQAEREHHLLENIRSLQEQNNLSAMETAGLLQKLSALEENLKMERNRAVQAEVTVVQEMMQNFKMKLESKINEAEVSTQHYRMLAHRWQEMNAGQPLPKQYQEFVSYYQQLHDTWTSKLEDIQAQLAEQKEQILGGRLLADMAITNPYPQLPRPPEGLVTGPNGQPLAPFMAPSGNMGQYAPSRQALPAPEPGQEPPTSATMATRPAQPRPLGLSGLSMPHPPAPLRPPLAYPGMPPTGKPSTAPSGAASMPKPQQPVAVEPAKSAPPPLRPISTSMGLAGSSQPRMATPPPLPVASSQQPLGEATSLQSVAGVLAPDTVKPQSSFDKVVSFLEKVFPSCDRDDFRRAIQELRQAHRGTLTGLSFDFITRHITQMLIARGIKPLKTELSADGYSNKDNSSLNTFQSASGNTNTHNNNEGRRTAPPPGLSPAWSVEGLELMPGDQFMEELDPCAICCEELSTGSVQTLECGHRYHDQCIRTWFRQQTTCPECRTYAPLHDDFPSLN